VLAPDAGERVLGHNAEVAFFAQHQIEVLDPARSALEELGFASLRAEAAGLAGPGVGNDPAHSLFVRLRLAARRSGLPASPGRSLTRDHSELAQLGDPACGQLQQFGEHRARVFADAREARDRPVRGTRELDRVSDPRPRPPRELALTPLLGPKAETEAIFPMPP